MKGLEASWRNRLLNLVLNTPVFHVEVLGSKFQPQPWFQLLGDTDHGTQQVVAQVVGFLPPIWETHIEFWVSGFRLAQTQPLKKFRE